MGLVCFGGGLAGCKGVYQDLCERASNCGGGGEDEEKVCRVELESQEEVSNIYGCEDEWDKYISCMDDNAVCEEEALRGCADRKEQHKKCVDTGRDGKANVELKVVD